MEKFIFFLLFQHLALTNFIGSDMGHLRQVIVVVTGFGLFATGGGSVSLTEKRNAAGVCKEMSWSGLPLLARPLDPC